MVSSLSVIGSSTLQDHFQGGDLLGARESYLRGLHGSWALAIALFGVASVASLLPKSWGKMLPPSDQSGESTPSKEPESPEGVVVSD